MRAVILCVDSKAERSKNYPDIPWMLVPRKGKTALGRQLEGLKEFDVCLSVRKTEAQFFEEYGLPLLVEKGSFGDAGVIKKFIDELGYRFLVIRGNAPYDIGYMSIITLNQGTAIMSVMDATEEGAPGIIIRGKAGHVAGFSDRRLADCGVYCMYKKVAEHIKGGVSQDICADLIPRLINGNELYYYEHQNVRKKKGA